METPIARVRGLGSAREGAGHWWQERQTSLGAFLLYLWLLVSLVRLAPFDQRVVADWLRDPFAAVPMLLLVWVTFRHLRDGLQVAVEDYVHDEGNKFFVLLLLNLFAVAAGALAAFAVLKIALGPPAA
ncbi:MAG: succinate dehydrogenase, hydrophobic membrane anchor protein [Alphaproteobacteria bacterium]|nr:succinate dehydrogenase, hydrophobic membrane anchor protein [Alphaproteobacteria bacterium]